MILAVVTRREGEWRIQALENVTLTDPMTGAARLRPRAIHLAKRVLRWHKPPLDLEPDPAATRTPR